MEYTTVKETAKKWGVTVSFVHIAANVGRIPGAEKIDGTWRIPKDAENPAKIVVDPKPGYISAPEAAKKWGVSRTTVCNAAKNGRIPGAELFGGRWHIPKDAKKPVDRRLGRRSGYYSPKKEGKNQSMEARTNISAMAKKLGVKRGVLYNAAKDGRIPGAKFVDGRWYIPDVAEIPIKRVMITKHGYLSTKEAAEKWGVKPTSVCIAAKEGRIPGAEFIDGRWHIPEKIACPLVWRGKRR